MEVGKVMKYYSEITGWGKDALFFLEDSEANFIIIFNDTAPPELAEISVLHTQSKLFLPPQVDDVLIIGNKAFTITAVGDEAIHTLAELGHCTLCFKGAAEPDRPGCIMVQGTEPLLETDIKVGTTIEIH